MDGFKLAEEICKSNPEHFYILYSIPLSYHLTGSGHKYLNTTPSIVLDPETGQVTRVHFNNCRRLPLHPQTSSQLQQPRISNTKAVWCVNDFHDHDEKRISAVHIHLEPGNLLTFDNHSLMHARIAYTGLRQMCGCYINKEDLVSKLRVLHEEEV